MIGKLISSAAVIATLATAAVPAGVSARDHDRYGDQGRGDDGYRGDGDRGYRDHDRGRDHGRHNGWYRNGYDRGGYYGDRGGYDGNRGYAYDGAITPVKAMADATTITATATAAAAARPAPSSGRSPAA